MAILGNGDRPHFFILIENLYYENTKIYFGVR